MLEEPFSLGKASCRVAGTDEHVTEPRPEANAKRVQPDVHAITVRLRCEDESGRPLSTDRALPKDWVVLLFSARGERIAPSTRTLLSDERPDELIFEITSDAPIVARLRRFDASSGRRTSPRDESFGYLQLSGSGTNHEIELRPRALTRMFEDALDHLIEELTSTLPGTPESEAARQLHRDILERSGARTFLALPSFETATTGPLVLSYAEQSDKAHSLGSLALDWSYDRATKRLRVTAIKNQPALEQSLACERDKERLRLEAQEAHARSEVSEDCHVLGLLLPGPCNTTDPSLLSRALDVLGRCVLPSELYSRASLPEDFQLTLRRGRGHSALDRSPRYLVSLFAQGEVVLHGKHWVNRVGRSDGRTSPRLLSGLYTHMHKLDWFDRKGGQWSAEACSTEAEEGQILTLHAGGRERMILDRDGCRGPFSARELDEVRQLVEAAIGIESYTKERPKYADPKARVWTVE